MTNFSSYQYARLIILCRPDKYHFQGLGKEQYALIKPALKNGSGSAKTWNIGTTKHKGICEYHGRRGPGNPRKKGLVVPFKTSGHVQKGTMAKGNKQKSGGIYIERELYQSEAFLSLNKNAIKVLFALLDNRKKERERDAKTKKGNKRKPRFINLDSLIIPYGTLEKVYKISRSNIPGAIDELLAKGFIKIYYHGGACKHDKSVYAWSDNYLLWTKHSAPFEVRPKRERRGYQGRRLGATAIRKQS